MNKQITLLNQKVKDRDKLIAGVYKKLGPFKIVEKTSKYLLADTQKDNKVELKDLAMALGLESECIFCLLYTSPSPRDS